MGFPSPVSFPLSLTALALAKQEVNHDYVLD